MARGDGRIEPGQRLTSAISARAWNRAQQAADIVLGSNPAAVAGSPSQLDHVANVAFVRNDSGDPVPVCGVLAITGVAIDPGTGTIEANGGTAKAKEFFRRPVLVGQKVTSSTVARIAVAMEPVAVGAVGRFAVSGIFPCKVKMQSTAHRYARGRVNDVTQLISTSCGPVKLLHVTGGLNPFDLVRNDLWAVGVM